MPQKIYGPCRHPRCPGRGLYRGWCEAHAKMQNNGSTSRPSAHARGYTAEWSRYSKAWLVKYPICGQRDGGTRHFSNTRCSAANLDTKADCVNHIVSPKQGGSFWNPSNHESSCRSCNTRHASQHGLLNMPLPDLPPGGKLPEDWG